MAIQASASSRVGDYILVKKLGEGGMAEVWLARHAVLANLRAIKFLNSQFQGIPEVEARFQNEGESKLIHPNIVRVYEVGQEAGSSYLVMEFVDGQDLENILNSRRGPLTVPESLDIGTQILAGLGFAHSSGIIHRDIKPSNVLVDREGHAYVMDFGIAKVLRTGRMLTQINSRLGTPDYMSPEQIRNPRDVDHRSDIYSFGCLFYELLTGWPPFDRGEGYETEHDIKTAHVMQPPTPPMLRKSGLPEELNAITLQCLEKAKEDRPQNCDEIIAALNAYRVSTARAQTSSRSATVVDTPKVSTDPGIAPRRETVVLPHGGAADIPEFKAVPSVKPQAVPQPAPFAPQGRTPTLVDTSQTPFRQISSQQIAPPDVPPSTSVQTAPAVKGLPKALIAAGILLVLIALGGTSWVMYHKRDDGLEATKIANDPLKPATETTPDSPGTSSPPKQATDSPAPGDNTHPIPPPDATARPHPSPSSKPKIDSRDGTLPTTPSRRPNNAGIPIAANAASQAVTAVQTGTLIWTGDATATRGHVTIVRSGKFAMPGGQLTGAMFPAAPLRVTVRTAGATVQAPKQQTSYNSLDIFLPNPGQQVVYIDWSVLPNP